MIFNVDPEETERVLNEWASTSTTPASRRSTLRTVRSRARSSRYARASAPRPRTRRSTIIVPEFVVRRYWHQFLHNQTALAIKGSLLFEPGVVVTSVPYHLR